jgi:hypothetical protein
MGRFSDLWKSGRFVTKEKPQPAQAPAPKAADPASMADLDLGADYGIPENSRQILAALSSRRGQETGRWLNSLVSEQQGSEAAEQQQPAARSAGGASAFDDVVALMDRIFKELSELTYEFNKSAVGTELMVAYEVPQRFEKKTEEVWYRPVERTYQGRLTTRQWALVIKGGDKDIAIYLVPASMLLALSFGQPDLTKPFMEIVHAGSGQWTIGGENTAMVAIAPLAKELLGDLIRVSSGVMNENELFAPHGGEVALGKNLAVGYKPEAAPALAAKRPGIETLDMHDACDIVDHIIDDELQRLYQRAKSLAPGTADTDTLRKQISAVENFRIKMIDAFEEYTHTTHMLEEPVAAKV